MKAYEIELARKNGTLERIRGAQIDRLIGMRYSISEQIAILRQRDVKPAEFAAFNDYAEACKRTVDESLGIAAKENAEA